MAIVLVKKDGTSNAKVGDIAVTGGGIYRKTETGSEYIGGLDTKSGKSSNYADVVRNFGMFEKAYTGSSASVESVDPNGIATVAPTGTEYDPKDYLTNAATSYTTEGSTKASSGLENIIGYALLFLIGIALLEKFFGAGSKKG